MTANVPAESYFRYCRPRRALILLLSAVVLSRCNCDDKITATEGPLCEQPCATTADCELCGKTRHECIEGACVEQPRACNSEGECCPGESCNPRKFCADRFTTCTKDADCAVPGQVCRSFTT